MLFFQPEIFIAGNWRCTFEQIDCFVYRISSSGFQHLNVSKCQCIREKTEAQNILKEIKQYQENWLQHVQRMDTNRLPKQALQYKPKGRRNVGRPKKRWRDQFYFEDQGTENTPNSS
jgi:hypothetical protein